MVAGNARNTGVVPRRAPCNRDSGSAAGTVETHGGHRRCRATAVGREGNRRSGPCAQPAHRCVGPTPPHADAASWVEVTTKAATRVGARPARTGNIPGPSGLRLAGATPAVRKPCALVRSDSASKRDLPPSIALAFRNSWQRSVWGTPALCWDWRSEEHTSELQ